MTDLGGKSQTLRSLNEKLQQTAVADLNEVPERLTADIEALRLWIEQQPHLRARTDSQFLVAFLRGCKFSLERAKSKIDHFYAFRTRVPELFACYDVDEVRYREALRQGVVLYLPTPLNHTGSRLLLYRIGSHNVDRCKVEDVFRVLHVMQEISMIEDDYATVNGITMLVDLQGISTSHLLIMTPGFIKKMASFSEQALPFRPQGAHFFNASTAFERIVNIMKLVLSEKQKNRLNMYGQKLDTMYEKVPLEFLPAEYGGSNGTIAGTIQHWDDKMTEYREYFKANAAFGTDEQLRPGNQNTPSDIDNALGINGSFRMLAVD